MGNGIRIRDWNLKLKLGIGMCFKKKTWPHQVLILGPSTRRVDVMPLHHVALFTFYLFYYIIIMEKGN